MEAPPVKATKSTSNDEEIPLAPLTQWGQPYADIVAIQEAAKKVPLPEFAREISASSLGIADDKERQEAYFRDNRVALLQQMQDHACLVLRDFSLMTTPEGFATFYHALQMQVCRDPLHSVAARPTVALGNNNSNKQSPIYEAVNKESRKNFFIGMHNEFVGTRAPAAAAFVCFTAAAQGGEFLVADGRHVFRALPVDLLRTLYDKQIRYSVMELPFFDWIDSVPEILREPVADGVRALVAAAVNAKVDFSVDLQWIDGSSYSSAAETGRTLQARAPRQPPIVPHPVTGDPTWFCNVHSHSALLRSQREAMYVCVCSLPCTRSDLTPCRFSLFSHSYGAERFEDGASRINKSDMYLGDDAPLTKDQLDQLDAITTQHIQYVKMRPGDVVLLDNYKTMHGRNVFDGVRKHAVAWFEGWNGK
jgi:Taurine catabolism dioxygenase TauD, TfdA family